MNKQNLDLFLRMFNCASKDLTRRHLQGVFIETFSDNTFKFTATDGHILTSTKLLKDDLFIFSGENKYLFDRDNLKLLENLVKQTKHGYPSSLENDVLKIGEIPFRSIPREYPNYRAIIPNKVDDSKYFHFCFNADLLQALVKTIGKRKVNKVVFKVPMDTDHKNYGAMTPILVESGDVETLLEDVVLMPMRHSPPLRDEDSI